MAIRTLSNNSTHQTALVNALRDGDPHIVANLVKFERANETANQNYQTRQRSASDYVYLTDNGYEITYDSQVYKPHRLTLVGNTNESIKARASNLKLELDGSYLGAKLDAFTAKVTFQNGNTTGTVGTITTKSGVGTFIYEAIDFVDAGFVVGDIVRIKQINVGGNAAPTYRALTITGFVDDGLGITFTADQLMGHYTTDGLQERFTQFEIDTESVTSLLTEKDQGYVNYLNREVSIFRALINPDTRQIIGEPFLLFKGIVTNGSIDEGLSSSKITWTLTSHWGDFLQVTGRLTDDSTHRALGSENISDSLVIGRPEYAADYGFLHANSAFNIAVKYQTIEKGYKQVDINGGWPGGKRLRETETIRENTTVLDFHTNAKSIPVVYGVRKVKPITVFVDTAYDNSSEIFKAEVLCEGKIGGVLDVLIDEKPVLCIDNSDYQIRNPSGAQYDAEQPPDIICVGLKTRGDVLEPSAGAEFATKQVPIPATRMEFVRAYRSGTEVKQQYETITYPTGWQADSTAQDGNNVNATGILDEEAFIFKSSAVNIECDFKMGGPNQFASKKLLAQSAENSANGGGFKIGSDYYLGAFEYWGSSHRLLDTAYAAIKHTIPTGESSIPGMEYIVKGKQIECHNYDYSYSTRRTKEDSQGNVVPEDTSHHTNFFLGQTVSLYALPNELGSANTSTDTLLVNNTIIIDRFLEFDEHFKKNVMRYRWETTPNLAGVTTFYMTDGTNYAYFKNGTVQLHSGNVGAAAECELQPIHLSETSGVLTVQVANLGAVYHQTQDRFFEQQAYQGTSASWNLKIGNIIVASGTGSAPASYTHNNIVYYRGVAKFTPTSQAYYAYYTKGHENDGRDYMTATDRDALSLDDVEVQILCRKDGNDGYGQTTTYTSIDWSKTHAVNNAEKFFTDTFKVRRNARLPYDQTLGYLENTDKFAFDKIRSLNTITLLSGAPSEDDALVDHLITVNTSRTQDINEDWPGGKRIVEGGGTHTQTRRIIKYIGATKVALVDEPWDINYIPTTGSSYTIDTPSDLRVSINPALQLLDYMSSPRYGKGLSKADDINLESFLAAARACDTRSDVSVVVSSGSAGGQAIAVGQKWQYPMDATTPGDIQWMGTVKSISDPVQPFDKNSAQYIVVTFKDNIGQLATRAGMGYESTTGVYWYAGKAYHGNNDYNWNFANPGYTSDDEVSSVRLGRVGYQQSTHNGQNSVHRVYLDRTYATGTGNPIIKNWDPTTSSFIKSGYSLYDASEIRYWKYLGWNSNAQRNCTRHQMNQVVNTSQPLFDNVIEMAQQFNGILTYSSGKYNLNIAGAKTAVDELEKISEADIIGGIKLNDGGLKGSKNYMSCTIQDPNANYEGRTVSFFDSNYLKQDKGLPKKGSSKLPGVTNYFNARIQVEQMLRKSRYGLTIQFTMGPKGQLLTSGSIIEITYEPFKFVSKDFRITSLTFKRDGNTVVTAEEHSDEIYKVTEADQRDEVDPGSTSNAGTPVALRPVGLGTERNERYGKFFLKWNGASDYDPSSHVTEIYQSYVNDFDAVVTTGSFVPGETYTIKNVGDTDFTDIGAQTNTVGEIFVANDVGGGTTGTAEPRHLVATTTELQALIDARDGSGQAGYASTTRYFWIRHGVSVKAFNISGSKKRTIFSPFFPNTSDSGYSSGQGVAVNARATREPYVRIVPTTDTFTYNKDGTALESGTPSTATLTANYFNRVAGNSNLVYAWKKNGTTISGATSANYTYTPPSALSSMPEVITVEITETYLQGYLRETSDNHTFTGTKVGATGDRGPGTWNVPVNSAPTNNATADAAWDASWTDRPGEPVAGDQAYFYTGSEASPTSQTVFIYNGSSWSQRTEVIDGDLLVSGSIATDKIAANAINTDKLAANTITTKHIEASSVVSDLITANSIKTDTLAANAITTDKLAANTITTKHIEASSVVSDLISANSVKTDTLAANAITTDKLAANTITTKHVEAASVVTNLLSANSIKSDVIKANAITVDKVAANAIQADQLAANSVVATSVSATSVVATLIDASAVTAGVIAANAITTDKISSNAVDADKINVSQLSAVSANMGNITAGTMKSNVTDPIPDANAAPSGDENGAFIDLNAGKFVFGDNSKYILWDGSDLTISGVSMSGVSIDNTSTIDAIAGIVIKEDGTQEAAAADTLNFSTGMNVGVSGDEATISVDTTTIATKSYVDTQVSGLVDSAPGALNTLNELAAALGDDANFSTTVTNSLAGKVGTSSSQALASTNPLSISGTTLSLNLATGSADTVTLPDNNTTYTTSIPSATTKLRLTGSDSSTDDITFTGGTNVTVTRSGDSELSFSSVNTEYSTATNSTLGLVKIGYVENNKNYPVELNNGQMFVNVPWENDNTQVTVHDTPVDGSTTAAISSNWAFDNVKTSVPASAVFTDTTFTITVDETGGDNDDPAIRLDSTASGADTQVVLTGGGATTITRTSNSGITISSANTEYSTATANTAGLVKIGYTESGKNYPVELDSGQMFVNVPWTDTNTQVTVHDTPVDGSTTAAISSNWAFDNVKTSVPANAVFTDTEYTAGTGLSLGGTEFSIDSTVLTTTGAQTVSGVKTHSANIELNNTKALVLKHAGSGTNSQLYRAGGNATRFAYYDNSFIFDAKDNNSIQVRNSNDDIHLTISPNATLGSSAFNLNAGNFQMGGNVVFDASRNLTAANVTANNLTTTGYLRGPASFTIDPATHGDNTGTVIIAGNLQVDGTTTTINSTSIAVDDLNITVASGAADAASANGAGLTVDGADATYTYTSSDDSWNMNRDLRVLTGQSTGTFLVGRYETQSLDLHVSDTINSITARQDSDENQAHYFRLNRVFGGSGANEFAIQKDGTNQLSIDTNANAIFAGNAYFPSGSSSAPGISFSADQDTGLSRGVENNNDRLWLLAAGGIRAKIGTHGVESMANVYTASTSSFRNYGGTWQATAGLTGNGFEFVNSVDGTAMTVSSTGNVNTTGDLTVAGGNVYITDTNTDLSQGGSAGQLKITTPTGYVSIGSENASWAHIKTDRPNFYFNTGLSVDTGIIASYNEDLTLSRANSTTNKVVLSTDQFQGYRDTTKLLQLGGFVLDTHSESVTDGVYIPGISYNYLAGASKHLTVTTTHNGNSVNLGDNPFRSGANFGQVSSISNTDTVIITITNTNLGHTSHAGIQFGGDGWRAKDVKIETSTDGSNYTVRQNLTDSTLLNHHVYFSTGSTVTTHVRYTLTNFAGSSTRITHIWAYDYNTEESYWPDRFKNNAIYGDFDFRDTYKATFGNSEDLQIYHNGNNSFIDDTGTGNLYLRASNHIILQGANEENMAHFVEDGAVKLFHNNTQKFQTASTGIDVTGNIVVSGTVDGRDIATDGTKLDTVDTNANNYTLPTAASNTLGGVKIGYTQNNKNYPVQLDSEKAYVNVPWSDNNTEYTAGDLLDLSTTQFNVDLSELTTTTTLVNSDHIVVLDNGAQRKITPANIPLTIFDATGFTAEADGGNASQLGGQNASYYLNTSTSFSGDVSGTYNNLALGTQSDITMTGDLKGPQNFTIDPADANGDHGNNNGTVVIAGNLQVDGTTTTINSTTLDVDDLTITVAKGAADSAAANGAGLHIDGANESLIWDSSNGYFEFTDEVFSTEFITGTTSTKVGRMNNDSGVFNLQAYTAREISFGNDTNGEHVRIDATGNVGIGATSPDTRLHVNENVNRTSIKVQNSNHSALLEAYGTATALDSTASNVIFLRINGANKVHLDNNGNFGIGVNDPSDELHVHDGSINVTPVTYTANADDYILKYGASNNSGWDGMGLKLRSDSNGVPFHSFCAPSGTSVLNIKGSKVGIGTTDLSYSLDVNSGTSDYPARFSSTDNKAGIIIADNDTTAYFGAENGNAFMGQNAGTHASNLNIKSNGRVGIGTTSPSARLHVVGETSDADDAKIAFRVEDSSGADLLRIRDAGEVIIPHNYLFVSASQGAYITGSLRARGGITNDGSNELSISSGNTLINFNNKNLYNIKSLNVAGRKITKTPTSKSFFVGNNDWTELCVGGGTKTYSATHQGVNINSTGNSQIVPVQMPIDPEATYRIRVRVKQVTTTSGTGKFYAGVQTLNEDLTNLASDGANSYNYGLASSVQLTAGQTYTFENTFKGYNSVSGTNANKFDPEGKYFNVVLITNYQGEGDTVIQSIEVQKVDENSSVGSSLGVGELDLRTTTTAVASTSATVVDTFSKTAFRSAKYTVQITQGSNYQVSEVLVLHNGSTASATEFAKIETNGVLGTLQTAINGNNVELKVTMSSSSAATVKVARHSVTV